MDGDVFRCVAVGLPFGCRYHVDNNWHGSDDALDIVEESDERTGNAVVSVIDRECQCP